ncbi:MAG: twitching motility protein PilI [Burkholderiaceae bacterium]|jgi:twitching motility protein PilI
MSQSDTELVPVSADRIERIYRKPDAAARRQRMRDFQSQLAVRMQQALTGLREQSRQLGLQIGSEHCLLNLREAGEIVAVGTIAPVPLTYPWFLGLANVRGNLVSVVDLAQWRGHGATVIDKQSRIIAFGPSLSFNGAVLVSRVVGLRDVAAMTLQRDSAHDTGCCYCDADGIMWRQLELSALIVDPQFLQVGL